MISRLTGAHPPQAAAAVVAFRAAVDRLQESLMASRSGARLAARGFADDVTVAAELDVDDVVPMLHDGSFIGVDAVPHANADPSAR